MFGIIKGINETLFEVASWLYLWPATLWRVLTRPGRLPRIVADEVARDPTEQYDSLMTPTLFFVVSAFVTVWCGFLDRELRNVFCEDTSEAQEAGKAEETEAANAFKRLNDAYGAEAMVLAFMPAPLVAAVVLAKKRREPLSKTTLKPFFFVQCYVWGASNVIGIPAALHPPGSSQTLLSRGSFVAVALWTVVALYRVARTTSSLSRGRAAARAALVFGAVLIAAVPTGFIAALVLT